MITDGPAPGPTLTGRSYRLALGGLLVVTVGGAALAALAILAGWRSSAPARDGSLPSYLGLSALPVLNRLAIVAIAGAVLVCGAVVALALTGVSWPLTLVTGAVAVVASFVHLAGGAAAGTSSVHGVDQWRVAAAAVGWPEVVLAAAVFAFTASPLARPLRTVGAARSARAVARRRAAGSADAAAGRKRSLLSEILSGLSFWG